MAMLHHSINQSTTLLSLLHSQPYSTSPSRTVITIKPEGINHLTLRSALTEGSLLNIDLKADHLHNSLNFSHCIRDTISGLSIIHGLTLGLQPLRVRNRLNGMIYIMSTYLSWVITIFCWLYHMEAACIEMSSYFPTRIQAATLDSTIKVDVLDWCQIQFIMIHVTGIVLLSQIPV